LCKKHDILRQAASSTIENADRGVFLGLALDISRNRSLAIDIQNRYNMPNAATLRSLRLDVVKLWGKNKNTEKSVPGTKGEHSPAATEKQQLYSLSP
jgi:hypothetical protein